MLLFLLVYFALPVAQAACTLSYSSLSFGNYTGAALNGTNAATVNCPSGSGYTIGLNAGTGSGATTTIRKLTSSGGATLNYRIFQDAARTMNWGNTSGTDTVSGTGTGSSQTINIYAQILSGQTMTPGTYTDTISSSSASFSVTVTISASCTLSATALAFGTYTGTVLNTTTSISVTCTNTTTYSIGLSAGTTTGATVTNRLMSSSAGVHLPYALYSDAARTMNWGSTSNTVSGTGTGSAQGVPVYGQIASGNFVAPGTYTDTITATITY